MIERTRMRLQLLSATILAGVVMAPAQAQQQPAGAPGADDATQTSNEIVVTATRRAVTLQDVPINISAIGEGTIEAQRIDDVTDIAAFTPGLTVNDTGPRTANSIVLRGITSSGGSGGSNRNTAVGVYLGEVPLYVDFKFQDIARVETLLGPQGTLYGLGTLSGAIRYIPNRPKFNDWEGEVHARVYDVAHASKPGYQTDGTINIPIIPDKVALRSTIGYYNDPGFIDYPLVVRQIGVSNPQPNLADPTAVSNNLVRLKDMNDERTFSARTQLGFNFGWLRPTFTYIHQRTTSAGDQANGAYGARYVNGAYGRQFPEGQCVFANCTGVLGTGKYENPSRVPEPSKRNLNLFAAEVEADLGGIAQLVSATAYSKQKLFSQGDIVDLLLDLDYGYDAFPAFAGYTQANTDYKQFNQEVRLTSTHGGPFNWVIGGFYNKFKAYTFSAETLPGYPQFAGINRPDGLEYISFTDSTTKERAVFGELTWHITSKLQVTGGARYYKYKADISGATDTPLTRGGRTRTPYPLIQFDPSRIRSGGTAADGFVYKANTSYQFSRDLLVYGTFSTGYRIGGVNRVAPCIQPLPAGQNVCALPNELSYGPDKTKNYEIGVRFSLLNRMLQGTVDAYNIDWTNLQLGSRTVNGAVGITKNASAARSRGFETTLSLNLGKLVLSGNYTYLDATLRKDAPDLIGGVSKNFLNSTLNANNFSVDQVDDAFKGDRLPGTSKHAGSVTANYTFELPAASKLNLLWTTQFRSSILSTTGARGYGEKIPGYTTSRASVSYERGKYSVSLFVNNVFDKYAISGVQNDYTYGRQNARGLFIRSYGYTVITPRVAGAEMRVRF